MASNRQGSTKRRSARKSIRVDQHTLDVARRILGTKTETETIAKALDLVAFRKELVDGVRKMYGTQIADFGK
jgi:Arc/MetJ family transcription regulator